ncbi:unnamed protein product (macronuclear) [Paramecium tetraurelia]|uniref:Sfi1 spindle body domain-containing protein n=1 Tax=Paramecium tetraurelia TaxID=5888 RepID=A0BIY6_PARTE|nr:uncharacterized protein GSPATT00004876001 [Paramecium tetraurelia]CAK58503.1 unnamed protein product [Paramecium tetraurelia]|eukprot:XP_001425901.1 hypothetical protein (macronuclear) [Paramecium tetraurelia strain d4-2]
MSKEVQGLLKTYLQVEKEAQQIKDKQIKLAKRIPEIGPHPQKQSQNKVKEQVSALKQKRIQLEKESHKISQEHDYMQQILQNELKKQLAPPQKHNDILLNLEKVAQETQFTYLKFRTEKFVQKLGKIFSIFSIKQEFLHKLKKHQQKSQEDLHQYIEFRNFQLQKKAFNCWTLYFKQIKEERRLKEEQQQKKYEMGQNQLALEFNNFCLTNKCFKALKQYVKMNKLTKQFETDQNQIKVKVNNFLNQMQRQISDALEKEKEEIQLIKQSNLINDEELTISNSQQSIQSEREEQIDLNQEEILQSYENEFLQQSNEEQMQLTIKPIQQPEIQQINQKKQNEKQIIEQQEVINGKQKTPIIKESYQPPLPINPWKQKQTTSIQNMVEDNEQSIQKQNSPQNMSQQSFSRQRSVDKKSTYNKELEEKAKKRKEMNEVIKKKHEDKKKQKEIEKQQQEQQRQLEIKKQKEEEYNRIQEKKKRELEQKQKMEQEKFELEYKTEIAIRHYEKSLQKYQIFIPILKLHQQYQNNQQRAENHYENNLKQSLFLILKKIKQICEDQREYEEQIRINISNNHYERNLKLKAIFSLKSLQKNQKDKLKDALQIREKYIKRHIMTAWYIQLPELRAENVKLERASERLVNDFRRAILQKQFFNQWKTVARENIAQRIREQNKQEMWQKVNQWLQEFDDEKIE